MTDCAPVVVFCYRRPDHLRDTLVSLMRCAEFESSPVIVWGDGPQGPADEPTVQAARNVAKGILGPRAEYHFSAAHLGLARSIIAGVGDAVTRYGRAIVIEDDLELSPTFLAYMNSALEQYADNREVFQVSGYMFDVPELKGASEAVFLPLTVSWGWGTWKRAWAQFDPAATGWQELGRNIGQRRRFNFGNAYDYATMLERQMAGLHDSWAIRWYWTVFKENGLVVFPPESLVRNHGFDGSGSHGRGLLRRFRMQKSPLRLEAMSLPLRPECHQDVYAWTSRAMRRGNGGMRAHMIDKLRRVLGR